MKYAAVWIANVAAFALIGFEGAEGAQRLPPGLPATAALLLRYDANHDGKLQ